VRIRGKLTELDGANGTKPAPSDRPRLPGSADLRRSMQFRLLLRVLLREEVLLALCIVLSSCQSHQPNPAPTIEFTKVPPAAQGGRERMDTIAGRVHGFRPGQQIVIYARSGPWWVQPWPDRPFIPIQADSTWSTETHLGYEYAALLVDPGHHPPPTMDVAPIQGGSVALVKTVEGVGTLPPFDTELLHFSGYDWKVQKVSAVRGGLNNLYDADNAWTDKSGALHLRIKKKPKGWTCAHLLLARSLGYGTYKLVVRDTSHLEPAAILSMHTFDQWAGDQHYREMDVEIGRWGNPANKTNAQYGVQPFYVPGNVAQFTEPSGTLTHTLLWESGRAGFKTVRGSSTNAGAPAVYQHTFTSGVPSPGQEFVELMLYFVASEKHPLQKDTEAVIERFEYLP
jgi:hypothetical protein